MLLGALSRAVHAVLGEVEAYVRENHRSAEALAAAELRARRRRIEGARRLVQGFFLLAVLLIGYEFCHWVHGLERGVVQGSRPGGVEGFLPIAALLSLRHLFETGEIHGVHPAGLVILLTALGLSLVAKKAFCSWVCPIGTFSEALDAVSRRLLGRRTRLPRWPDRLLRSLKYLLLGFFAWAIFVVMDARAVTDFLDSPYNRVADIKMLYFFERASPLTLGVLGALVVSSLLLPYVWCRYLCPYGALLGALSLVSPLKISRTSSSCIRCGRCSKACPARLPVAEMTRVHSDECMGCLSCVAACPVPAALSVETPKPWRRRVRPFVFFAWVVGLCALGIGGAKVAGQWDNGITDGEYARRIRNLESPAYNHERGRVPSREQWEAWERETNESEATTRD